MVACGQLPPSHRCLDYAPSGMNKQSPIIIAVTNKEMRDRLSNLNLRLVIDRNLSTSSGHNDPFYGAPVVLVVLAKKEVGTRIYDGSLVMENMMIAANSLGLGSCWIHRLGLCDALALQPFPRLLSSSSLGRVCCCCC